jgi:hypothetical protein
VEIEEQEEEKYVEREREIQEQYEKDLLSYEPHNHATSRYDKETKTFLLLIQINYPMSLFQYQ